MPSPGLAQPHAQRIADSAPLAGDEFVEVERRRTAKVARDNSS
jgi:hypothetical protein